VGCQARDRTPDECAGAAAHGPAADGVHGAHGRPDVLPAEFHLVHHAEVGRPGVPDSVAQRS
jgi:hypothetical protein